MKRYTRAAKSRPYTVTKNKLYKAVAYRDTVITTYVKDMKEFPNYFSEFNDSIREKCRNYSEMAGVPYENLQWLECRYIVDTQGHVDSAKLSDNEPDLFDNTSFDKLSDAIRSACDLMIQDLSDNSNSPEIVGAGVYLTIYGYGNHYVEFTQWQNTGCAIYLGIKSLKCKLYDGGYNCITGLVSKGIGMFDFNDVFNNTTYFKKSVTNVTKYLAQPIGDLTK